VKFYEIKVDLDLKNKIHFQKAPQAISKLIASFLITKGYNKHNENIIKNYVFSNLGRAKNGFYEGQRNFIFRTFDREIANYIMDIDEYEDKLFKVKSVNLKPIKQKRVKKIVSINPVFVTIDGKKGEFWTFKHDLNVLLNSLNNNLLKKYNLITQKKLTSTFSFIELLQVLNSVPFSFYYKNKRFLGYRLKIVPKEDEISQKLAFIALGAGLGEKNSSVGGGFCKWE